MTTNRQERTKALKHLTSSYKEYEESRWKPNHLMCKKRLSEAIEQYETIEAKIKGK